MTITRHAEASRHNVLAGGGAIAASLGLSMKTSAEAAQTNGDTTMSSGTITTRDGARIFYKDWGPRGAQPIVFHHGWPLSGDD
ncbi:MAG: alpha/beta hydrolase [Hyphomonadaceae bacterium]|nr:alpha/beta hydrolase [Hyphomonadaceae bacterium]